MDLGELRIAVGGGGGGEKKTQPRRKSHPVSAIRFRNEGNEHHCVSSGLLRSRNQDRIGYIGYLVEEIPVKGQEPEKVGENLETVMWV